MTTKLTTVNAPKNDYTWPKNALVQISAATSSGEGQRHEVFMDGKPIGTVESFLSRPSERVTGTRLRRDLPERIAWKASPATGAAHRPTYTARIKAIRALILAAAR